MIELKCDFECLPETKRVKIAEWSNMDLSILSPTQFLHALFKSKKSFNKENKIEKHLETIKNLYSKSF